MSDYESDLEPVTFNEALAGCRERLRSSDVVVKETLPTGESREPPVDSAPLLVSSSIFDRHEDAERALMVNLYLANHDHGWATPHAEIVITEKIEKMSIKELRDFISRVTGLSSAGCTEEGDVG